MWKAATLIIFECIQLSGRTIAVDTTKQNEMAKSCQNGSAQCTRKRSFQKNDHEVTSRGFVVLPRLCSWQSKYRQQSLADREMLRLLKFSEPIHFQGDIVIPPRAKRPCAWLGKYASITAVDLIQRKKLDFHKSNLTEARYEIIKFSTVLLE